jgi:hypothetical protein
MGYELKQMCMHTIIHKDSSLYLYKIKLLQLLNASAKEGRLVDNFFEFLGDNPIAV